MEVGMTIMKGSRVVGQVARIYEIDSMVLIEKKRIQIGMSDIDDKARNFLYLALDEREAQLNRIVDIVDSNVVHGEGTGA